MSIRGEEKADDELSLGLLMAPVSESPPVTNMIHFSSLMLIEVALCSSD